MWQTQIGVNRLKIIFTERQKKKRRNGKKEKGEKRKEKEKELFKEGKPIPQPTWRELELEEKEEKAFNNCRSIIRGS